MEKENYLKLQRKVGAAEDDAHFGAFKVFSSEDTKMKRHRDIEPNSHVKMMVVVVVKVRCLH